MPIASAEVSNAGGLGITLNEPCPDGGSIDTNVEETAERVVVTARWSDAQLRDCDGGAPTSDQRSTGIGLSGRVGDRPIVDGSTGDEVPTSRP